MRGYGQRYCPIARASEVFAERWTPIIVRNLLLGCRSFTQILEGAPGISRTLLAERLRVLGRAGIVERRPNPGRRGWLYRLTPAGEDLQEVCDALGTWGARWLEVAPEELDPGIVLWAVARTMNRERLPERRVVVRFDLRDVPRQRFWLVVEKPDVELCRKHPGFEEDLIVTTDSVWAAKWHMGWIGLQEALGRGLIRIDGPPRLVRAFATWGGQTPFRNIRPMRPSAAG